MKKSEKRYQPMTKQELMETYTAEQLAEMVIALEIAIADKKNTEKIIAQYNIGDHCCCEKVGIIVKCPDFGKEKKFDFDEKSEQLIRNKLTDRVHELESEVERYRKSFEDAKKERDFQIVEYQKKIKELTGERDFLAENSISTHQDPIDIAKDLINAEGEYEHNPIEKALCGEGKGIYRIFDIGELRQIAEHLLVHCNHNGEVEE